MRYSSAIAIHWSSGDPGKGPVTRYVLEARPSGTPPRLSRRPRGARVSLPPSFPSPSPGALLSSPPATARVRLPVKLGVAVGVGSREVHP